MPLKWSCFLSFRGGKGDLAVGIVDLFARVLTNELELQTEGGLYRYTEEMVAGDIIDPSIAEALTDSACMIVLFTGKYFSKAKSYCAREYLAMTRLEKARLALLSPDKPATKGLIVPVILRNPDRFPPRLKSPFMFDFTEFGQDDSGISKPPKFFKDVRKIADYVADRYLELDDVLDGSETLKFPDESEALKFLASLDQKATSSKKKTTRSRSARK